MRFLLPLKSSILGRLLLLGILISSNGLLANDSSFISPADIELSGEHDQIIVTEKNAKKLVLFDLKSKSAVRSVQFDQEPTGSVCSKNGEYCYVTGGVDQGVVWVVDLNKFSVVRSILVGHSPCSPVLSQDEKHLYVCNRFDHAVGVVDLEAGKQMLSIPVKREPVAADITANGHFLFVANHMPDGRADLDYVASKLSVIDVRENKVVKSIKLVNGAEGMRGVCVSPDGKFVYATHLMARYQVPTTQIERGWINTNALSVIRVEDLKLLYTVLLDDVDLGFANPWAVQASEDGQRLCVSSAGGHQLRLIDLPAMTKKIEDSVSKMGSHADSMHLNAHNDLSFISDVSKRINLEGIGPRSLLIDGDTIYIAEYYSDSIGKVVLNNDGNVESVLSTLLGESGPMTAERQGEIYFNDASLCFQKWQSCASCHSDDGRTDALNWDLLNDGIGNPKNVKSLVYSHITPPVMSLGVRKDAETAVRAGIKYIQFAVRPEEDAEAIDAFLKSLKPLSSPELVDGQLSESAEYGEIFFEQYGCVQCHPAPLYSDLKSHRLGTGLGQDADKAFDTPTLLEVWRTSPYMHDGRAVRIEDVLKIHNPLHKGDPLPEQEIKDLAAYVRSL